MSEARLDPTVAEVLRVDAATLQVVTALSDAGVPSILLKGPGIARRFYASAAERGYRDVDLLVSPAAFEEAEAVLRRRGYCCRLEGARRWEQSLSYAHTWVKQGQPALDLHFSFHGIGADPSKVWEALSQTQETLHIGQTSVRILNLSDQALIVALHAFANNEAHKSHEDLRRAIAQLPESTWREALAQARRLEAASPFAQALRFTPEGSDLADRIGAPAQSTPDADLWRLWRSEQIYGLFHLHRWLETPGTRGKLKLAMRMLVPTPTYIAHRWPLARRGPATLAACYVAHLGYVGTLLPRAAWSLAAYRLRNKRQP